MARLLIVEDNNALASLLVSAVEAQGHVGIARSTGQSALQALATESFDAALVDLLLPDVHGYDVLDRLAVLKIPAFAMSGVYKGDAFAIEAVESHGARAFFEKPFDLDALLTAFEEVCGKAPAPVRPAEPDPLAVLVGLPVVESLDMEPELPAHVIADLPARPGAGPGSTIRDAAGAGGGEGGSAAAEAREVSSEFSGDVGGASTDAGGVEAAVALPFAQRDHVWQRAEDRAGASSLQQVAPEWAHGGDLSQTPVPKLLNAFYESRSHGELKLKRGNVLKLVLFEEGRPIYAASNVAQERFARFCARQGLLNEGDMAAVAQLAREESVRTGDAMVRLGLLSPEQRTHLLIQQVKEIIWSTFGWSDGQFSFEPHRSSRAGLVKLSVFPGDLILQGVMKTETLVSLRAKLPPDRRLAPTADPPYALHDFELTGPQALLLVYADGSKRVEDLLALTELSERDALATLRAFELLGLVEERRELRSSRISFGL